MNKYFIIAGVVVTILVAGVGYSMFFVEEADKPLETGRTRELTITAKADNWLFDPEYIEVDQGDRILLTVINEDPYDHGFAIDAFGITQRLPASETIHIDFIATKPGDFPYYCSVPCGSGEVDGVERGHFDQIGRLHVRSVAVDASKVETETPTTITPVPEKESIVSEPREAAEAAPPAVAIDAVREATFISRADIKVQELGYDTTRFRPTLDKGNAAWLLYHGSLGEPYLNDSAFSFLEENDQYVSVYYSTTEQAKDAYVWIFMDVAEGKLLGSIETL